MKIDIAIIEKVAHLARLEVKEEDKQRLVSDMGNILTFMEKLNEVDTADVKPLVYMTDEYNVLREDVVIQELSREEALKNAPDQDGKFFRVAKVIK